MEGFAAGVLFSADVEERPASVSLGVAGAASFAPSPSGDPSGPALSEAGRAAARAASFLAQPEPLKTTAAAEMALRSAPPHASQVVGPSAWMP